MPVFAYSDTIASVPVTANESIQVEVTNKDGSLYGAYQIDKQGNIDFSFNEPGNYEFYVKQNIGSKRTDVKYDETRWYLLISVMDEKGDGTLTCYSVINNVQTNEKSAALNFNNIYPEPETTKPNNGIPSQPVPTGDTQKPLLYGILAVVSLSLMGMLIVILIKNRKTE